MAQRSFINEDSFSPLLGLWTNFELTVPFELKAAVKGAPSAGVGTRS